MKVNYKSDFKITEVLKDSLVGIPFTFIYNVGGVVKEVSFDGTNYQDCHLVTGKNNVIEVVFDNHGFPTGQMNVTRYFDIPDTTFPDGKRHEEYHDKINVELVHGNGDKQLNLTNYLVPSFLKPVKGQDYWTSADQSAIVADTKTSVLADTAFVTSLQGLVNSTTFQTALKSYVADALKADTDFNDDIRTGAADVLKTNSVFNGLVATNVGNNLKADTTFLGSVGGSVKTALSTDTALAASIAVLVDTDSFRSAIKTAVANALSADSTFKTAISTASSTSLQADATFQSAVATKVANALKEDTTFKSAITTAVETALKADENFLMAVNRIVLADVIAGLKADTTFVGTVQTSVNSTAFQSTIKTETADALKTDTAFIAAVKAAVQASSSTSGDSAEEA